MKSTTAIVLVWVGAICFLAYLVQAPQLAQHQVTLPRSEWTCTKEATASAFKPEWVGKLITNEEVVVAFCVQWTRRDQT